MATIISEELKRETSLAGIDAFLEKPLSVATIDHVLTRMDIRLKTGNRTGTEKGHENRTTPERQDDR